ncbi:hypothetical protein QM012_009363 [Aureobasidium pullulans]|uniref:Uncharacterized protein n=1 Tax=Aureobasidium pullulans TaxID=5580 RepID=A0ABR0THI9_AURPU
MSHRNTSAKDAPLYGAPRPAKKQKSSREISSSNTLAFTSQLQSLISAGPNSSVNPSRSSSSRPRPKKEDIFASHNRNVKKRAQRDLDDDSPAFDQKHSTSSEALDSSAWHRSKRKMEEKARLYAAMKRGDVGDDNDTHLVDFDRKWADQQDKQLSDQSSSDEDSDSDKEMVEWEDEFGRTRTGTAAQRAREQRLAQLGSEAALRSRPDMPTNLIVGDTVQAAAFNPDEPIAQQMAELAAKRDRSLTPPPDTHFDSSKEIRQKGVGFMQFSLDDQERNRQFENLEMERAETERVRSEREKRIKDRKDEIERRRNAIRQKRGKKEADDFLTGLGQELGPRPANEDKKEEPATEES